MRENLRPFSCLDHLWQCYFFKAEWGREKSRFIFPQNSLYAYRGVCVCVCVCVCVNECYFGIMHTTSKPILKSKSKSVSHSVVSDSLWPVGSQRPVGLQAPLSIGFTRKEFWSVLPFSSSGDLPTQGLNPGLLHCRQILYCLSYQGSPKSGS